VQLLRADEQLGRHGPVGSISGLDVGERVLGWDQRMLWRQHPRRPAWFSLAM